MTYDPNPCDHPKPRLEDYRNSGGRLNRYTSYGCYPLFYLDSQDNVLCADCANESEIEDYVDSERPIAADANWEDPHLYCDGCSKRIESAYAEDEVAK